MGSGFANEFVSELAPGVRCVHYAKSPIAGELVLPWNELPEELRLNAGNEGRIHANRFPEQWRPDLIYIHVLPITMPVLHIGAAYSSESCWAYEVAPVMPLWRDPERGGHLATSWVCRKATVLRRLHPSP